MELENGEKDSELKGLWGTTPLFHVIAKATRSSIQILLLSPNLLKNKNLIE